MPFYSPKQPAVFTFIHNLDKIIHRFIHIIHKDIHKSDYEEGLVSEISTILSTTPHLFISQNMNVLSQICIFMGPVP